MDDASRDMVFALKRRFSPEGVVSDLQYRGAMAIDTAHFVLVDSPSQSTNEASRRGLFIRAKRPFSNR